MTNVNKVRVTVAGATGWAGSALSKAIIHTADLELVSAVSRQQAGGDLGKIWQLPGMEIPVFATADEALQIGCDVFVEYTKPDSAKRNVLAALAKGCHVVIGTSGLTDDDFREIGEAARQAGKGVLAAGNFSLTAVLLQKFAEMAAKYIPAGEVIDYAGETKIDSPSGTARELANRLGAIREASLAVPLEQVKGLKETRGARLNGVQVHSIRLPGYIIGVEALFGLKDEKLTIRHEAGSSAEPYIQGALMAIRKVHTFTGLKRGLDQVMD